MFSSKKKIKLENQKELLRILEELNGHLKNSRDETIWAHYSASECIEIIEKHIQNLKRFEKVHLKKITGLFLPAASLQEISLDNNWGDEFLKLAAEFDSITSQL